VGKEGGSGMGSVVVRGGVREEGASELETYLLTHIRGWEEVHGDYPLYFIHAAISSCVPAEFPSSYLLS